MFCLDGYLVWGVENATHEIKGSLFSLKNAKEGNQDLELWFRQLLHLKISFEIFEFDYQGKHIVLLRIPAAITEPTQFKKIPRIRISSHKTDLRNYPDYIRQIYNTHTDWSAQVIEAASIQDLDTDAIKKAREKYKQKHQNESFVQAFDSWEDKTFLDKAKLLFEKQKLKDWVSKFLDEHQQANRKQIDELLWNLLPEDWATKRKKNKIVNLLSEMKREGLISNKGKDNPPCWVRNV